MMRNSIYRCYGVIPTTEELSSPSEQMTPRAGACFPTTPRRASWSRDNDPDGRTTLYRAWGHGPMCAFPHVCVCVCMCVCVCVCVCVCMFVSIYIYMCLCLYLCVHLYI
ncbi:unnamed protein product [Gadus morhua 'NCC']